MRFLILAVLALGSALAQSNNQGAILGTVTDPAAGAVVGCTISAVNAETRLTRTAVSGENGDYRIDFLPPGVYQITAEQPGFKRLQASAVTLQVGQVLRLPLKLELGQVAESVTVSAEPGQVNTETPSLGQVIDNQVVKNLPLNGREFLELAALVPGAESGSPKRGVVFSKGIAVGINGARSMYNGYYFDGADSTDANQNQLISSPSLDAVREFRVETNMYSAQYGRSGGAVISIVTKSGTNELHGSLYEFHRNQALDASPYFYTGTRKDLPKYLFNQFGATAGGPVIRNKTFFFGSWEGFRQKRPAQQFVTFGATDKERVGDFTSSLNPYSSTPVVLRNPYSGEVIPGNQIPASLINPAGKKLMELVPAPNYVDPFLNLRYFRGGSSDQNKYLARMDHQFNSSNILSGTFNFGDYDTLSPAIVALGDQNAFEHDRTMVITFTRVISPRMVNDLKVSHTWFRTGSSLALNDKNYGDEFGLYNETTGGGAPVLYLYTQGQRLFIIGGAAINAQTNRNLYIKDLLVRTSGRHTIQLGADYKHQSYNWTYEATGNGGAYWIGLNDGSGGPVNDIAGHTFADLLMGSPSQLAFSRSAGRPSRLRRTMAGLFVQDDFKVHPRFTLNLGFRWDYETPFGEVDGRLATLNFATGLVRYPANGPKDLLSKLTFPHEEDGPNRAYDTNWRNFAPRIGFAFRPFDDNKTAIRGGYGLFYTSETAYATAYASWVGPFAGQFTYSGRAASLREPANRFTPFSEKPYRVDDFRYSSPGSFFPNSPYYPQGYMQQWNFTISRELGGNIAAEVGYVGSKGTNLSGVTSLAIVDPAAQVRAAAAIPGFAASTRIKGFNSKYNSLQAKATKRFSQGVNFLASYTFSRAMAESSNDQAVENLFIDIGELANFVERRYARADFDVSQRFSLSGGYELPFGARRHFKIRNSIANVVAGDWNIQGIVTFSGGYPFTVYNASLRFPDRVCDGNLPSGQRTVKQWFDYNCFPTRNPVTVTRPDGTRVSAFANGNAGPNVITGPGLNNFDFGLHKEILFTEAKRLQFRFESFNFFNHPNTIGPGVNYFFNTPTGAEVTRAKDQRSIQMALKFLF